MFRKENKQALREQNCLGFSFSAKAITYGRCQDLCDYNFCRLGRMGFPKCHARLETQSSFSIHTHIHNDYERIIKLCRRYYPRDKDHITAQEKRRRVVLK